MRALRAASLLLAALVGSGCVQHAGAPPPPVAPRPLVGADDGGIFGVVLDDARFPVPGVDVTIVETHERTRTDLKGHFTFDHLDPGDYRLVFRLVGYQSPAVPLAVAAAKTTTVRYTLAPGQVAPDDLRVVVPYKGLIECSANPYYALNPCGAVAGDQRDRFRFQIDPQLKPAQVVLELVWHPSLAGTSKELELAFCDDDASKSSDVACLSHHYYRFQSAGSPNVLRLDDVPFASYRSWLASVGAGFQNSVVVGQSFDLFVTVCYYRDCGADYSAIRSS